MPADVLLAESFFRGVSDFDTTDFYSDSNIEILRSVFQDLYYSTEDDIAFSLTASLFLYKVYHEENEVYHFSVCRSSRGDSIEVKAIGLEVEKSFTIRYEKPLLRERQSWHKYFMRMAERASERTTCRSGRKVGAVFVKDNIPLISGYNGVPSGFDHPTSCARLENGCKSGEGMHLCPCLHAEANAVGFASRYGISLQNSILYCTALPCATCAGMLSQVKVVKVVYKDGYPSDHTQEIFERSGIAYIKYKE